MGASRGGGGGVGWARRGANQRVANGDAGVAKKNKAPHVARVESTAPNKTIKKQQSSKRKHDNAGKQKPGTTR